MPTNIPIYTISITKDALNDLDRLEAYITTAFKDSVTAQRQEHLIRSRINKLNVFPNGCPIFHSNPKYRVAHVKHYKIIFEVDDTRQTVSILRIMHSRQNI